MNGAKNDQFIFKFEQYILGKMNIKNDEFEILLFARLDAEKISLPSIWPYSFRYLKTFLFITKICAYAFTDSQNLRKVEIPKNLNLQIIEKNAFFCWYMTYQNYQIMLFNKILLVVNYIWNRII